MNTKHTPAPWKVERNAVTIPVYNNQAGAEIIRLNLAKTHGENEANARLIASAPELLDVLSQILEHCALPQKVWGEGAIDVSPIIEKARNLVIRHKG